MRCPTYVYLPILAAVVVAVSKRQILLVQKTNPNRYNRVPTTAAASLFGLPIKAVAFDCSFGDVLMAGWTRCAALI